MKCKNCGFGLGQAYYVSEEGLCISCYQKKHNIKQYWEIKQYPNKLEILGAIAMAFSFYFFLIILFFIIFGKY